MFSSVKNECSDFILKDKIVIIYAIYILVKVYLGNLYVYLKSDRS